MSLYKDATKSEYWYASITIKGKPRIRRSTGTTDKTEAKRIHDEWRAEAWRDRPVGSGKNWNDAAISWLSAQERGESDRYLLRAFSAALGTPLLDAITTDNITRSIGQKSAGTWNRYRNTILAILHHAQAMGWIDKIPTIPSRKTPAGRTRWLTQEEWRLLEAQLPSHLLAPARFALATGIRQSNLLGLRWSEIDMKRKVMWIHPDEAKAKKAIGIPMSDQAVSILLGQVGKNDEFVFTYQRTRNKKRENVPMAEIGDAYKRAVERAGLSDTNWHTLRHTWASWHVMAGTPVEVLQKLGGWSSLSMVLRYAHLAPEYLASWAGNSDILSDRDTQSDTVSGGIGQKKGRSKAA
jgi:integrase